MSIESLSQMDARRDRLRSWYKQAMQRKLEDFGNEKPYQDLTDYATLFEKMRGFDRIVFFGGCSLTVLQHILQEEPTLSRKIEYYQQGVSNYPPCVLCELEAIRSEHGDSQGTFNSKLNILGNPLNFALNFKAADFVFQKQQIGKLAKFVLVPTDTTKRLEFTLKGLKEWSPAVGLHSLGFVSRIDPWDFITQEERDGTPLSTEDLIAKRSEWVDDPKYADPSAKSYKGVMADLVAFLISFTNAFDEFKTPHGVVQKTSIGVAMKQPFDGSNQMVLVEDSTSPIQALKLEASGLPDGQDAVLVEDTRDLVETALATATA